MERRFIESLAQDVKELRSDVTDIKVVLAQNTEILDRNTESLREHMARTEILEKAMEVALTPIKFVKLAIQIVLTLGAVYGALKVMGLTGIL